MPSKSLLLHRQKLVKSLFALLDGLGNNHFAHGGNTVGVKEHMLGTAKADAFRAEFYGLFGVIRGVGVCADLERSVFRQPSS